MQKKNTTTPGVSESNVIGAHLRRLREQKMFSLERASREVGLSNASTLSLIETGKTKNPRLDTKRSLAELYGFTNWEQLVEAAWAKHQPVPRQEPVVGRMEVLRTPDKAYSRLCNVIRRLQKARVVKDWYLGALHGVDEEKRHPAEPNEECAPKREFDKLLLDACKSVGDKHWRVKMLMNLIRPERLAKLQGLLDATADAIDFEVKFVVIERSLSMLSPCILGDNDVFIGIQDPSYYRVQSAIHLQGPEVNRWLRGHWSIIWAQAKWLRKATALVPGVLEKIHAMHAGDMEALKTLMA